MLGFLNFFLFLCALGAMYAFLTARQEISTLRQRELAYLSGITDLIDQFEQYSEQHAVPMAKEAELIGRYLGLTDEGLHSLCVAALLHDCGEWNLPREMIQAQRDLTNAERYLLRTHPLIGEMAIRRYTPEIDVVSSIIRWHHERWDGGGYPDGLMGEDIPLSARILTVVDAASAMSQDRPHRKALSASRINEELERLSALQFDPDVVQARTAILRAALTNNISDVPMSEA